VTEKQDPASEPVVERVAGAIEGAMRAAVRATNRRLDEMPGARVRRLRRRGHEPLPYLYDVHPEARHAAPRQLGTLTIDVDEVAGTAAGPPGQRGGDFLPPKPFRSLNWAGRWQRIRAAHDRLAILPPIDVVRYGRRYWVVDGHNRVAAALYNGQLQIDANVVDLGQRDEAAPDRAESFAATLKDHDDLMAVLRRRTTSDALETSPDRDEGAGRPGGAGGAGEDDRS
jgi:hypothetical protein